MTRFVRTGTVVVAGLAASLALTACGSDDEPGKGSGADPSASATPGPDGGKDSGGGGTDAAALEGTWAGLTGGKNVTVSIAARKVALVADQSVCQGEVKDMGGAPMLALTCPDGGKERTMGAIDSVDGTKLVVSWEGGAKDSLTKVDPGKLPTDLPSLPELPDLPEVPAP